MHAPRPEQQREAGGIGELEEGGETRRLRFVGARVGHGTSARRRRYVVLRERSKRKTYTCAPEVHDSTVDRIVGVADRAAERALDDVTELHARRGRHQPALLVRRRAAQRVDQLDEHAAESSEPATALQLRERRSSSTLTDAGVVTA